MTHVTCRLTAKNRGQLLLIEYGLPLPFFVLVFMFLMIRQLLRPYLSTKSGGEFVGFARTDRCSTEWCGVCSWFRWPTYRKSAPTFRSSTRANIVLYFIWRTTRKSLSRRRFAPLLVQCNNVSYHTHTHTRLTALCPGLPGWASTKKAKPIWILLKQKDSEWQWHQLGHMQVCTSLQTDNHASSPHHSVFYRPDALPAAQPTASKHLRHQNTSHLNAASGKSSWWARPTRLKRALTVTLKQQVK